MNISMEKDWIVTWTENSLSSLLSRHPFNQKLNGTATHIIFINAPL